MIFTYDPGLGADGGSVIIEGQSRSSSSNSAQQLTLMIKYRGVSVDAATKKLMCKAPQCKLEGWVKGENNIRYELANCGEEQSPLIAVTIDPSGIVAASALICDKDTGKPTGNLQFHIGECIGSRYFWVFEMAFQSRLACLRPSR